MTDWGVHLIDIVLYATKPGGPKTVMSSGGKFEFPDDAMETPDTQQAVYEFENFNMIWEHAADIEAAANTAIISNLGNIAFLTGEKLHWDHQSRQFKNHPKANSYLKPQYRHPWTFPLV